MSLKRTSTKEKTFQVNGHSVHVNAHNELLYFIQNPILAINPQRIITYANRATQDIAGKTLEEIIGKGVCEILHGEFCPHMKCPLEKHLLTCNQKSVDINLPGLSGEYHLVICPLTDTDGKVYSILLQAHHLTRAKSRKAECRQTEQLPAIGELAAVIAHEVNNPINGIINYAQILLDDAEKNTMEAELLGRIVQEGERVAMIICSLVSFARDNQD